MKWNTFIRDIPMYTLVEFFFVKACFITLIWPIFIWWLCFVVDYIFVNICKFYLIAYLSKILLHFLLAYNQFLPRTIYRQCIVILSTLKVIYKKMMWQCTGENWSYASNCIWEWSVFKQMMFITVRSFRECLKPSWKRGRGMKNWEQSLPRQSSKTNK